MLSSNKSCTSAIRIHGSALRQEIIGGKYRTKVECIDNEKGEFKVHQIFIYANKLTANLQLTISLIA